MEGWHLGAGERSGGEELRPLMMERSGSVHSFLVTPDDLELPSYYHSDLPARPLQYADAPSRAPLEHDSPAVSLPPQDASSQNARRVAAAAAAATEGPHQPAHPLSASAHPAADLLHRYDSPRQSGELHHQHHPQRQPQQPQQPQQHHHLRSLQRASESAPPPSAPAQDSSSADPPTPSSRRSHQQPPPSRPINVAQRRYCRQHTPSPSTASTFERIASAASSEAGGTPRSSLMSDSDASSATNSSVYNPPHRPSSSSSSRPYADATAAQQRSNRDARANQLHSVPETSSSGAAADPTFSSSSSSSAPPPAMSSQHPSASASATKILRTGSIDSSVSSVSSASTPIQPSSANNPFSNARADSPADIQALIRAAGSPEELIKYLLKDKQSLTAQNAQLWRLVDKQRAMVMGLTKDLERALQDKERYRRKMSQQTQMTAPPMSSVPSRSVSESPAPSFDDGRHDNNNSPAESARSESVPLVARDMQVSPTSMGDPIAPFNATGQQNYVLASGSGKMPGASHMSHVENVGAGGNQQQYTHQGESSRSRPSTAAAYEKDAANVPLHSADWQSESENGRPQQQQQQQLPLSVITDSPESFYRDHTPSPARPMTLAKKLGISTNVPPAMGMGKSPLRKAPPAPLELSPQREDMPEIAHFANIGDVGPMKRDEEQHGAVHDRAEREQQAPPQSQSNDLRSSVPPSRPATGPPKIVAEAGPSSPRTRPQFLRNGIASPGLPSSPRPVDRPPNSPMPRRSLDQQISAPTMSPRGHNQGTGSLSSLSNVVVAPAFENGHTRNSSLGNIPQGTPVEGSLSTPVVRPAHSESSMRSPATYDRNIVHSMVLHPAAINSIDVRVVSSRLRPSRMSMMAGKAGSGGDSVFTLGVFSRVDNKEIVRVEKDVQSLNVLDAKLRKTITFKSTVPDKSLFSGHAPAKIDARRAAIDGYFEGILNAVIDDKAAMKLCEFFSVDVIDLSPPMDVTMRHSPRGDDASSVGSKIVKEGYLTKRGKNFGGWKERYFVLDGPILKYFDGLGGVQLGQIKLQHAQIGRQSSQPRKEEGPVDEETQYRHAFLVLEPKKKDSATLVRHVLCAESDEERDEWVDALLMFVERSEPKEKRPTTAKTTEEAPKKEKEKEPEETPALRTVSYEEANPGPIPARGPTPEDLRKTASPSPNSITNQPGPQFSTHAPVPERGPAKQISAPQGGTVISDLSAWGAAKKPNSAQTEKALKKRSIFSFGTTSKQRSHDPMDQLAELSGHQAAAQRFPLPRAVFGASLEEAVYLTKPPGMDISLPAVVYRCIEYLNAKNAADEEGIFRLSGSNAVIKGLKERFNSEADFNLLAQDEYYDVHAIAGLLKLYLRELPSNVLTTDRREDFVKVTELTGDPSIKIAALNDLVHSLPIENFTLLKALSGHLLNVVDNAEINKMTIRNVGIVFSPTLNIPAQVFSMFLEKYFHIFFREGEPPSPGVMTLGRMNERPQSAAGVSMHSQHSTGQPPSSERDQQQFHSHQAPPPQQPQQQLQPPPASPHLGLQQPTIQQAPRTPMTSRPPQLIPLPVTPAFPPHPPDTPSYEPTYETRPAAMQSPTTPRFPQGFEGGANGGQGGGLAVPGSDAKSQKSKRRESSMMFMKGLKSPMFGPPKGNNTTLVVEDSVYE